MLNQYLTYTNTLVIVSALCVFAPMKAQKDEYTSTSDILKIQKNANVIMSYYVG